MTADPVLLSRLAAVAAAGQSVELVGDDVIVADLEHDSRAVSPGAAFIAVPGSTSDGHDHAELAVQRGAVALIVERRLDVAVPQLIVERTRELMAPLAAEVHGHPGDELLTIGVTGTNGKTTVTHYLEAIGVAAGRAVGIIGTIGARIIGEPVPLGHTTPEATHLQRLLRRMVDAGVELAALEVSSHAIAYGRADALHLDVAAFTNLTQDHLDFHADMEDYYSTKRRLFTSDRADRAVVFVDDDWGKRLASEIALPCRRVSLAGPADVWVSQLLADVGGTTMHIESGDASFAAHTHLAGTFNAANALVAAACALEVGLDSSAIAAGLEAMTGVPGRFERIVAGQDFPVIVDYAHTPDAISAVIAGSRTFTAGRIIAVGGAGGDRDRAKRPLMGAALAGADVAVLTSDNPRSEDPAAILEQVAAGVPLGAEFVVEADRRTAIRRAIEMAAPDDVVLILGKGHETGQEIAGVVTPFDDRIVARQEVVAVAVATGPLHWTLDAVAKATRGRLIGSDAGVVRAVTTDSRGAGPGALFVALRGERFDGHDFAGAALEAGAVAAVVQPGTTVTPRIEVDDTSLALRDLAAAHRNELGGQVIAVTGSTGKTSTKDLLAAALPGAVASPKSFNNEVGVPLTMLSAPASAPYVVAEVGSRGRGHIAWLGPAVRPDVAIITNLGVVHLETFGTVEVLADAKWELVETLEAGGTAVVPVDDARLHRSHGGNTLTFGRLPTADVAVADLVVDDDGRPQFELRTPQGRARVWLPLAGAHQALNAAAAVAAGIAVGVDLDTMVDGMAHARGSAWRMEIHRGRYTVVNDAYNANPDSVQAALETVAALPGRHVAVLGEMAELGPVVAEEHRRMGAAAARLGYAAVVIVGNDPGYAEGAGSLAVPVADADAAFEVLGDLLTPGDVVLVKASRVSGLERLALRLATEAAS